VTFAKAVEIADGTATVRRQTEAGADLVECPLPAVVSVTAGVVEPRYPSFRGIMGAKRKPVDVMGLADLGIASDQVGWAGGGQQIVKVMDAPERAAGEVVVDEGNANERIVDFLEEVKVI